MNGIEDLVILCCGLFSYSFNGIRSECLYLCEIPCLVQCMAFGWWNFQMVGLEQVTSAEMVSCLV
jgi:ABC-type proline/glycine betaine transport system permease subunit